jgi:hypothetical protein
MRRKKIVCQTLHGGLNVVCKRLTDGFNAFNVITNQLREIALEWKVIE